MLWQQLTWHDVTAATPLSLSRIFLVQKSTLNYILLHRESAVAGGQAIVLDPSFWVRRKVPQHRWQINHIPTMYSNNQIFFTNVPTNEINPLAFQRQLISSTTIFNAKNPLNEVQIDAFDQPPFQHPLTVSISLSSYLHVTVIPWYPLMDSLLWVFPSSGFFSFQQTSSAPLSWGPHWWYYSHPSLVGKFRSSSKIICLVIHNLRFRSTNEKGNATWGTVESSSLQERKEKDWQFVKRRWISQKSL